MSKNENKSLKADLSQIITNNVFESIKYQNKTNLEISNIISGEIKKKLEKSYPGEQSVSYFIHCTVSDSSCQSIGINAQTSRTENDKFWQFEITNSKLTCTCLIFIVDNKNGQ